jgi:uncharacterized membrane protein YccC
MASETSDPARERLPGRLLDRIAASDPALSRLRLASRAMLSLGLSGVVLAGVTFLKPLPIAAYGITAVVSFVGSMSVRDKSVRAQMVTRVIAAVATTLSVLLASLLAPVPLVADLVFLAVIFLAVYARRYGPRGFSVGMIAFMAYFMGDYLRPAPSDIGWVAAAIALAFAVTHLMTFIVLPDDPERDFRRSVAAIDRRINLVLRELMEPGAAGVPNGDTRKVLQAHLARLHDTVLMAEGFIPQGEAGSLAAEGAASDLAIALFELQLAVERLVAASFAAPPPADLLLAALRHEDIAAALAAMGPPSPAMATARILLRVQRTRSRLEKALDGSPSPAFAAPATTPPAAAAPAAAPDGSRSLIPPALQRPVQVTLACAIAIGCGLLVSPVRWDWAVITAFIVFNNTRSRADTAVRALQRSAGTFGGLIVGTGVATLVHGQPEVSVVAILVLFFFAFYFVQTSYSLMIFLVTVALALLYGLMGMFSPELLMIRLAETLVGGLAGALVAFLVYPTRASTAAAGALDKYLAALRDLVAAARGRAHGEEAAGDLFARSRVLDRRYADLALAVRPIGGPWSVVTRFGQVREKLLLLAACTHWARALARSFAAGKGLDQAAVARIDAAAGELDAGIAAADARRASFFERREGTPAGAPPRGMPPDGGEEDPAFALEVISVLIARSLADGGRTG